jgi:hypothetical protein
MSSSRRHMLVTIVGGMASGLFASLIVTTFKPIAESDRTSALNRDDVQGRGRAIGAAAAWLTEERRHSTLLGADGATVPLPLPIPANLGHDSSMVETQPDQETGRTIELARWSEHLRSHEAETVDPAWASTTTPLFESDASQLAEQQEFELISVRCKSSTCSVTVEWSSYESALEQYNSLLHYNYRMNCMREILLPEPSDRALAYRATMLYDCSRRTPPGI